LTTRPASDPAAAQSIDRTPHWLIKQAIFNYLEKLEGGATLTELNGHVATGDDAGEVPPTTPTSASSNSPKASCRSRCCAAITAAYRRPEPEVVPMLLEQARLPAPRPSHQQAGRQPGRKAAQPEERRRPCRHRPGPAAGVFAVVPGSVALMCLAEALLRIPDKGTRDALIRDKISTGTGSRTWATARRCSSTPPPGACC
jgi:RHH-type proline utilization regulon transcriptional repressor/proline dehydrogenase/delta 1-pyrroline-5-carboxylate dehydrogenase